MSAEELKLSPMELLALARCIKDGEVEKARAQVKEGTAADVRFSVQISGNVHLGVSTKGGKYTEPAKVSLCSYPIFCAVLRRLKIGPARLLKALLAIETDNPEADKDLEAVFTCDEGRRAAKLPAVEKTGKSRAGSITTDLTHTKLP